MPFPSICLSFQLASITLCTAPLPYLWLCLAGCGSLSFHTVYPGSMWQPSVISHSSHCQDSLQGGLAN